MEEDVVSPDLINGIASAEGFRLDPDYTQPKLEISDSKRLRIQDHLANLYGRDLAERVYLEVERRLRVHHCHKTPALLELERQVDPACRFSHEDVLLITYGDVIESSAGRSSLRTLADFAEEFFQGLITILHILPFYPYSSDRGFSVISFRKVDPRVGSWEDILGLDRSFRLMFDGVFNHVSTQSRWFRNYRAGHPEFQDFFIGCSTSCCTTCAGEPT